MVGAWREAASAGQFKLCRTVPLLKVHCILLTAPCLGVLSLS